MSQSIWQLSSLVNYLKRSIDADAQLQSVLVQGEISNLVKHRSGHFYFTLKDEKARMNAVMFATYARSLNFDCKDGTKVIVHAKVSVYEPSGSVQLIVSKMQQEGIGDLYYQLEQTKKKLNALGYFDRAHKKALPEYPMDIAYMSAKEGAATQDVRTTLQRRWPLAQVTFYPCLVQGKEATTQLIETLKQADQAQHDVILIVRGGGSIEDLWCFNAETLALAVYEATTPIVSGVGHETDTTLIDYVSDSRAPTPTAAAELVTPDIQEVLQLLEHQKLRLIRHAKHELSLSFQQLSRIQRHPYFLRPYSIFENEWLTMDVVKNRLMTKAQEHMRQKDVLQRNQESLFYLANAKILEQFNRNQMISTQLIQHQQQRFNHQQHEFSKQVELLDAYSPLKAVARGYSISKAHGSLLRSVDEVQVGDEIETTFMDGKIVSTVQIKEKQNE